MVKIQRGPLIKKNSINDWGNYSGNIERFPYVKKYLENLLKQWIENISNPLAIEFVVSLLTGELERSDEAFKELEDNLGEDNLRKAFEELETENAKGAHDISKKNASLWAELLVAKYLISRYNSVERYKEKGGDWCCNNSTIVSVKTKLDLNLKYNLIGNSIFSLFCLKENDVLRRYNKVSLMRDINIDDSFRNKIIWFLENHLSDFVVWNDKLMYSIGSIQEELQKLYNVNNSKRSILKVKLVSGIMNGVREIVVILQEKRSDDQKKHSMEIYLKEIKNDLPENYYMTQKDTDGWWGEQEIYEELLRKLIEEKIKGLDKDYKKSDGKGMEFIGWININLHPRYQNYLMKNEVKIRKDLFELFKNIDYKGYKVFVSFALSRAFWIEELKVFEIG